MSEEFGKNAQQMASENPALQKKLENEQKEPALVSYHIEAHDFDGSVKEGELNELNIPAGVIPMGFEVIIQDMDIPGVQHREYWLDSKEPIQSEWSDDGHTKFVAVIDGKLKRYKIITRVYCMTPKTAGVPVPEVPVKRRSSGQEIEDILNAVVDSKDHSEVLRLIEAAKEKLYNHLNINIDRQVVGIIKAMGTPHITAEIIVNPTHTSLGEKVFPLLNDGFNVFIERQEAFSVVVRPFTKAV